MAGRGRSWGQAVDRAMIEQWKQERGYHLPRLWNAEASGTAKLTDTIFWKKCMPLFAMKFGRSDLDNHDVGEAIASRIGPSLNITLPMF
jgi:peptide/nickel transport system permease protein